MSVKKDFDPLNQFLEVTGVKGISTPLRFCTQRLHAPVSAKETEIVLPGGEVLTREQLDRRAKNNGWKVREVV